MFESVASHAYRGVVKPLKVMAVVVSLTWGAVAAQEPVAQEPATDTAGVEGDAAAAPVVDTATTAALAFQQFCNDWLEKLIRREEQNVANIQWVTSEIGVRGTFTGYSRRGQCETKRGTDAVPVGKLTYKQIEYEKKGPTLDLAEISPARPLSVSEVTEIFHYADGRWIY